MAEVEYCAACGKKLGRLNTPVGPLAKRAKLVYGGKTCIWCARALSGLKIKINTIYDLNSIFTKIPPQGLSSDILFKISEETAIPILKLTTDYSLPGYPSQGLGFLHGGPMLDSLLFFDKYFLLINKSEDIITMLGKGRLYVAPYESLVYIKKNNFKWAAKPLRLSESDHQKLKKVLKETVEGIKSQKKQEEVAETNRITKLIKEPTYTGMYIGGHPDVTGKHYINICAIEDGIYVWKSIPIIKMLKELFLIPWKTVEKIQHSSMRTGDSSTKQVLGTYGALTGNEMALAAGLLGRGVQTKHFFSIITRDQTGFESEICFESKQAQEVSTFLTAQRSKYYKPEHTQEVQTQAETPQQPVDIPAQIKKLSELKDADILTQEEFEQKKKELLERL